MSGACEYTPSFSARKDLGHEEKDDKNADIFRLSSLGVVTLFVAWLHLLQPNWLANIVIVITVIAGGYPIFKESLYALRKGRLNMELSMVIAIIASLALFQLLPAIVITFFALLSEFVEGFIVKRGRKNIQLLYDLAPRKAIVKTEKQGGTVQMIAVDIDKVNVGDIVLVREGDIIPVDGHIVSGSSMVDQSSITGESISIEKNIGDVVLAGTINQTRQIEAKCEKASTDTTFAKIIQLVEEAEASKAPIQKLSDKMATRLIQFAIGLSVLTYIVTQDIVSTLSVIVVAGACGLAVGTPIALLATTGKLSKRGIIVKGGIQIENLKNVGTVVFDKTGTLTYGKPVLSKVVSFNSSIEPKKVLEYAAIAEKNINHPLAKAIEERAKQENIVMVGFDDSDGNLVSVGKGVTRTHNGQKISVGNQKFMEQELSIQTKIPDLHLSNLLINGKSYLYHISKVEHTTDQMLHTTNEAGNDNLFAFTTTFVAVDKQIVGAILFEDTLRKEAKEAISKMKSMGIRIIMLTGDNEKIAKHIAYEARIDEYHANLLPHDKVSKIEEIVEEEKFKIQKGKNTVMMVGDGINDAPALAKADIGIAMGRTGTDVAVETADVVLMTEDLQKIPYMIKTSRQSVFTIQQNFFGTLSVDGIGFVLAATGNLNPLFAAFIHIASELIFMVNSARLIIDR